MGKEREKEGEGRGKKDGEREKEGEEAAIVTSLLVALHKRCVLPGLGTLGGSDGGTLNSS